MNAGLLDMLHDAGDIDVLAVGDRVDIDLDRVAADRSRSAPGLLPETFTASRHVAVQRRRRRARSPWRGRRAHRTGGSPPDSRSRPATASASAAERAVPLSGWRRPSFFSSTWKRSRSSARSMASGEVPRIGMPAASSAAASFSGVWPPNCTMTPSSVPRALLDPHQLDHVLGGQRLEIEPVRGVVVGRHRLRIAVDHDGLEAGLVQRIGGVDAAIVELDALADAVRAAAEDDHLALSRRLGLAFGRVFAVALVAGIHVGRGRGELGGAGVDALVDRADARAAAQRRDLGFASCPASSARRASEKPSFFSREHSRARSLRQAVGARPRLPHRRRARSPAGTRGRICRSPWISSIGQAEPQRLRDDQQPVRRRPRQRRAQAVAVMAAQDLDLVEAGEAGLHRAQRLLHRLGEAAADRHRLADGFHRGGQQRLGARELLEGEARHLGDDIVDGRLERGRRHPGDVVGEFVERVADRELGRDLGDRESRWPSRRARRSATPAGSSRSRPCGHRRD